jgi:ABC-type dipeptide/oligopeptide/nickel transport system permease subunit
MGLCRNGGGNDRGGDTQLRCRAITGDDICHYAELAAGGGWNGGALKFMILPMVALSLAYIASIARITRGSMIEVLHSNFIRTARAKGCRCAALFCAMR